MATRCGGVLASSAAMAASASSSLLLIRVLCRSTALGILRPRTEVCMITPHQYIRARPCSSSSSSSSFGLSLESLETFSEGLEEERKHQSRLPGRRRASNRCSARKTEAEGEDEEEVIKSFESLPLSPLVKESLEKLKLYVPTDVQHAAIPVLLRGDDAAVQSFTGSGKTLAYLLPILSRVGPLKQLAEDCTDLVTSLRNSPSGTAPNKNKRGIEAVIVAPSRELAMQIVRECERILGPDHKKAVQQLVGGANRSRQDEALKKNKPSIVVGTPGRISEISREGKLHTHMCLFLVLDEADELLSIQFREDMRRILEHVGRRKSASFRENALRSNNDRNIAKGLKETRDDLSGSERKPLKSSSDDAEEQEKTRTEDAERVERQTVLVSATMPSAVLRAAAEWGQRPVLIKGKAVIDMEEKKAPVDDSPNATTALTIADDVRGVKESLPPNLQHFYAISKPQHKVDMARKCIHATGAQSIIVFMNHPRRLKDAVFKLEARGIIASSLHGELSKLERTNTLAAFRNRKIRVLVTSEVGARGLDIPDCDLVVNLELPTDMTHYAHRAGRTGRIGRKGTVVSICGENEVFVLKKFQRQLGIHIEQCELIKGGLVSSKESNTSETPTLVKA